ESLPPPRAEILRVDASGEALAGLGDVRLPYHRNHLFFHVRGIDLCAEERLLCQYRLEGFDSTWTEPSPLPRAPLRYTNLPPGEYRFHFRVGRRNGEWSPSVTAGPFRIRSPFWQRPWVQILGLVSLLFLGWWIFHTYAARHKAAMHDPLTGLPNRALFVQRLTAAVNRGLRDEASSYALLFLDVDRFKNVNDSLGHLAGDQLLEQIADRLRDCLQPQDVVARLGGDEFTILLEGVRTPKQAGAIAERLQRAFEAPFSLLNHEVFAGASIGIALGPGEYVATEEILRDADIAMYRAKERGRGCYEFFNPSMHASAVALLRLETELRRAIERSELILLFQPILSLDTGRVASCEALLRWQH
ncbi:MAG: diguanylate cyclase, partial [Acidobacteria bacterium]|nr:diguanylate cyclase [Acidobacteriota bacterium]